jgi:hypothetical protein
MPFPAQADAGDFALCGMSSPLHRVQAPYICLEFDFSMAACLSGASILPSQTVLSATL